MVHIAFISCRIKFAIHMHMERDVEDVRILVECLLATVACINQLKDLYETLGNSDHDEHPY